LTTEDGELRPLQPGTTQTIQEEEKDFLSNIISNLNDKYKTDFTQENRVILNHLFENIKQSAELQAAFDNKNNSRANLKLAFNETADNAQVGMIGQYTDFFSKLGQNQELKSFVFDKMFEFLYKQSKVEK